MFLMTCFFPSRAHPCFKLSVEVAGQGGLQRQIPFFVFLPLPECVLTNWVSSSIAFHSGVK